MTFTTMGHPPLTMDELKGLISDGEVFLVETREARENPMPEDPVTREDIEETTKITGGRCGNLPIA